MALHRLTHIVMGVPNVEETAAYYAEFGLIPTTPPAPAATPATERARRARSPPSTAASS